MACLKDRWLLGVCGALLLVLCLTSAMRAQQSKHKAAPNPGPMLSQGTLDLETPEFKLKLVRSSQTVAALAAKGREEFDFTPGDLLVERSRDGYYHLGDLDLRLRTGTAGEWKSYSTAFARVPVLALPATAGILASADLAPTFASDIPLRIVRTWSMRDGKLVLSFTLRNKSSEPVQIGALGIPMIFNNILTDRTLDQAHALCSFYDPYIGEDAGYLQVTRLNGHGPALLVVPDGKTPFEAYKPILGNPGSETKATLFTMSPPVA